MCNDTEIELIREIRDGDGYLGSALQWVEDTVSDRNQLAADNIALQAEVEALRDDRYHLAFAICGGEDVPGLLDGTAVVELELIARNNHSAHMETIDRVTKLEAENAKLREKLSGILWMADEWFEHGGGSTMCADEYAEALKQANDILNPEKTA